MSKVGTLTKELIEEYANKNQLITKNFDVNKIKETCYLASTSNEFFEITDRTTLRKIEDDDYIVLKPNNSIICKTKEKFQIPTNCIAKICLTGHFFAIGISPVNTFIDPGFEGHLGIVLTNSSKNYIKISPNSDLVKIEFSHFDGISKPYVGQHGGELKVWPYRSDLILSEIDLNKKGINPLSIDEIKSVHGESIAMMIESLNKSRKSLYLFTAASGIIPIITIWAINEKFNFSSPIIGGIIGVASGIIANYIYSKMTRT